MHELILQYMAYKRPSFPLNYKLFLNSLWEWLTHVCSWVGEQEIALPHTLFIMSLEFLQLLESYIVGDTFWLFIYLNFSPDFWLLICLIFFQWWICQNTIWYIIPKFHYSFPNTHYFQNPVHAVEFVDETPHPQKNLWFDYIKLNYLTMMCMSLYRHQ